MREALDIFVPGKCHSKGSPRPLGKRLTVHSKECRHWENLIGLVARQALGPRFAPLDVPCWVACDFLRSDVGKHTQPHGASWLDVDKMARAVLDALTGVLYINDSRVVHLLATKGVAKEFGVRITGGPLR